MYGLGEGAKCVYRDVILYLLCFSLRLFVVRFRSLGSGAREHQTTSCGFLEAHFQPFGWTSPQVWLWEVATQMPEESHFYVPRLTCGKFHLSDGTS